MNTKNILTLIAVVMGLQSVGIFFGREAIVTDAFAPMNPDATGIKIGMMMHEVIAVFGLTITSILLAARNLPSAAGSRVLMGASVGLALTVAHGVWNVFTTLVKPPLPLLLIMGALTVVGFITASKAANQDSAQ